MSVDKLQWQRIAIILGVVLLVWGVTGFRGGSAPGPRSPFGSRAGFTTGARVGMGFGAGIVTLGVSTDVAADRPRRGFRERPSKCARFPLTRDPKRPQSANQRESRPRFIEVGDRVEGQPRGGAEDC